MTVTILTEPRFSEDKEVWIIPRNPLSMLGKIFDFMQQAHKARLTSRTLRELDDRMLRDIGLTRSDLMEWKQTEWRNL